MAREREREKEREKNRQRKRRFYIARASECIIMDSRQQLRTLICPGAVKLTYRDLRA